MIEAGARNAASVAGDKSAIHPRLIASCWESVLGPFSPFPLVGMDKASAQDQEQALHRERIIIYVRVGELPIPSAGRCINR